jgi:DNA gyrase subunit A
MATNIPPHNLKELSSAINYMIDNYEIIDDIPVEDLMKFVTGPDFPTGGIIVGKEGIEQAYGTGRGRIVVRGVAHIEEMKAGRYRIVITEIPYQVNKTTLIERIADLARSGKIDEISDLRDESDRRGMNIVIELKKNSQPKKVLNRLFKYTALQSTFGVSMLALVDNQPRTLPLKKSLLLFIQHRQEVITRRIQFDLDKALHRAHILEGLMIALTNLDDVIDTIRKSPDAEIAKERLVTRFTLSEIQAQAILDMQLRRLAALERQKIEDEYKQVKAQIAYFEELLADPKKILAIIQEDMLDISEKFGDERRTRVAVEVSENFNEEDLVADEAVLVSMTARGYIKRVQVASYRSQGVGGKGVTGHSTKQEDEVINLIPAHTLDTMLFFSDRGKVYAEKVYQIPDADRTNKGIPLVNILSLDPNEVITAAVSVPKFEEGKFITLATSNGRVKRMSLSALSSVRPSGIISINLADGEELGWARLTNGKDDIILVTEQAQAVRFSEEKLRSMGRTGAGVRGIRLDNQDKLTSMEVVEPEGSLLVVTTKGYGKRTLLSEYPSRGRGAKGIATTSKKSLDSIGLIASARVVQTSDVITIMSANGHVLRAKVKNLRLAGRTTRGVKLMGVKEGDRVVSLARTSSAELQKVGAVGVDAGDDDNGLEQDLQIAMTEPNE